MAQTDATVVATPPSVTLTAEQFQQLLAAAAGGGQAGLTAEALANAFHKAERPENPVAPGKSFVNPRGELKTPKPKFVARKTTQNGMDLTHDTLGWEEVEALNALATTPGDYLVTRADGSTTPFKVTVEKAVDGKTIERLDVHFPCKHEMREGHRPLFEYCLEAVTQSGREDEAERLRALKKTLDKERAALVA
jgi:hypothetical protein